MNEGHALGTDNFRVEYLFDKEVMIVNQKNYFETCLSNLMDFTLASHSVPIASDPEIMSLD